MTKETLLEYINDVDEDLIEKVPMEKVKKKPKVIRYIAVAASLFIAVGVGLAVAKMGVKEDMNIAQNAKGNPENLMETIWSPNNATFAYNNSNYRIISDEEYLISNSLPVSVQEEQVGVCLANNIGDATNNMVLGDLYAYGDNDLSVILVKMADGSYEVAVKEDEINADSTEE